MVKALDLMQPVSFGKRHQPRTEVDAGSVYAAALALVMDKGASASSASCCALEECVSPQNRTPNGMLVSAAASDGRGETRPAPRSPHPGQGSCRPLQRPPGWDDFDLSDALGDIDKKPTVPPPKRPNADDDFDLQDALGGGGHHVPQTPRPQPNPKPNPKPNPQPQPKPEQPGSAGGFSDSDLLDGTSGGAGGGGGGGGGGGDGDGDQRRDGKDQDDAPGVVPGIIGAVVVAVAGAISSFIAYQKKKFCFKENADQGEMNMENHRGTNAEPPVQQTLLEK
ncbi:CD99 antigen [Pteropus alecto]|uniref:CD99 antigen n=1 Tax=Pteropus alecto TaxID=9402 RepID=UPI000D53B123|nr:CD99 antigen [Pteropus alecto]